MRPADPQNPNIDAEAPMGPSEWTAAYLAGDLTPEEAEAFERRAARDPQMKRDLEACRRAMALGGEFLAAPVPGLDRVKSIPIPRLSGASPSARVTSTRTPTSRAKIVRPFGSRVSLHRGAWGASLAAAAVLLLLAGKFMLGSGVPTAPGRRPTVARGGPKYGPGLHLSTDPGKTNMFELGPDVRVAMAGATTLRTEADRIELESGSVWLYVRPGGAGFRVQTPAGEVKVLGTSFGVSLTNGQLMAEVIQGSVWVTLPDGIGGKISPGEQIATAEAKLGSAEPRSGGTELPVWVAQLESGRGRAAFLPSLAGGSGTEP